MFIFSCAGCGAGLTAPLSRVALPVHARQKYGNGTRLPVLMEPGTFAVDPEPSGPPWRSWEELRPGEAAARGLHAPVRQLSDGPPGAVLIAPGDALGTVLVPERCGGNCCGIDGTDGPNMACGACGLPVATRIDECSLWQVVRLVPDAVTSAPSHTANGDGADAAPLSWAEALRQEEGTPPVEPVTLWGGDHMWSWSPRWEAAAGRALAHLLAASGGRPVTVPKGLPTEIFQRALDALLPVDPTDTEVLTDPTSHTGSTDPRARRAVLAGPGLPVPDGGAGTAPGTESGATTMSGTASDPDILLVPTHPRTGEMWTPPNPPGRAGPAGGPYRVPLPFGVWRWLAFPEPHLPALASGTLPGGVLRDDPPAPLAHRPFWSDAGAFEDVLVRLPAVRAPWLREILEDVRQHRHLSLF
ncbi:hypothetical protein ACIQHY_01485 [Streptomyces sp. NPDC092359]|uniref:hypothetical protein n=1 Tax=Streptomyces sp. NPDC092359 TaxID=3366014 RepID=UPI003805B1FC